MSEQDGRLKLSKEKVTAGLVNWEISADDVQSLRTDWLELSRQLAEARKERDEARNEAAQNGMELDCAKLDNARFSERLADSEAKLEIVRGALKKIDVFFADASSPDLTCEGCCQRHIEHEGESTLDHLGGCPWVVTKDALASLSSPNSALEQAYKRGAEAFQKAAMKMCDPMGWGAVKDGLECIKPDAVAKRLAEAK